jgi:hypothetical protein
MESLSIGSLSRRKGGAVSAGEGKGGAATAGTASKTNAVAKKNDFTGNRFTIWK